MARGKKGRKSGIDTTDYRHTGEKRKNIPLAKIAAEGKVPKVAKIKYHYNPHLPPILRFDSFGASDKLLELVAQAGKRALKPEEQHLLATALQNQEPWLEWAEKKEQFDKRFFEVDPVVLHIHERVSSQACIRTAMREDAQRDLFADPEQPYKEAVQFYRHDLDWANRLILGDSLQVMSSLAKRENLSGKVQMIYIDPPYGIDFKSNFQPEISRRDVKEKEQDLTRESEMVQAFRDTWQLGIHSYLTYLRDRLIVARELISDTGSIFVQIGEENLHLVRVLMDEIFGPKNACGQIGFQKTGGFAPTLLSSVYDYLLWYAKDKENIKFNKLFRERPREMVESGYNWVEYQTGERRRLSSKEKETNGKRFQSSILVSAGASEKGSLPFDFQEIKFFPAAGTHWKTSADGLQRLNKAERLIAVSKTLAYVRYVEDFLVTEFNNVWSDTVRSTFAAEKKFVVQTSEKVVDRCMLMATDPGDLVLDPTCGSGTTAIVAEERGRRWITIDTSRVALSIARQRLLTSRYEYFKLQDAVRGPSGGFSYKSVPHITLKSIAQNVNLDPIFAKHESILEEKLISCNKALAIVTEEMRRKLKAKLLEKEKRGGKRVITEDELRRWELPKKFEHWTIPFDTDPDWPLELQSAVAAYRTEWREKVDEVNTCISTNAEQEELVDQPKVVPGVLRVSGPFTVEGIMPEELNLGEEGLFDGTPESYGLAEQEQASIEPKNLHAYLTRMFQSLRLDGVTFLDNKRKTLSRIEPLFENSTGSLIHSEGVWEGGDESGPCTVAVSFGPQYGPVTALQVEEVIRESKRYDELVIAGFSFDPEASAVIQENTHPKLRIHQAYIRPDINPGMDGLLKETPNSQLFTVFGQPDVEVKPTKDGKWVCKLKGVDIYDPLTSIIRSTGASKVAAWFLDSDYDGRCFCITQAFFPDQDAWGKIAKALKSSADPEAFEKFKGTESLPFPKGKYKRIAVKVIDPRGNEVMAIRNLKE